MFLQRNILTMLVLFWAVCLVTPVGAEEKQPERPLQVEHVFIISVDGLSREAYTSVPVNHLRHLASEGVIDQSSLALKAETCEAAEASLLAGAWPQEHRFYSSQDQPDMELLTDVFRKYGKKVAIIDGSGGKLRRFGAGEKDYISLKSSATDREVLQRAMNKFRDNSPYLTYVYLDDCMKAMLSLDEKTYFKAVQEFDEGLGNFLAELRKEKLYYRSCIIVTGARSSSASDQVPLVIRSPRCVSGGIVTGTMTVDIAPTLYRLTAMEAPEGVQGIPVYEAFTLTREEQEQVMRQWVKDLKTDRMSWSSRYWKLEDELYHKIHQLASLKEEKSSVYSLAGEKEQLIEGLQTRLVKERCAGAVLLVVLLAGYLVEFKLLKKKFLLFK